MLVIKGTGKIYNAEGTWLRVAVTGEFCIKSSGNPRQEEWWGDFVPEYRLLLIEDEYVLELLDKRKGRIAITDIDIRCGTYHYQFQGAGALK